MWNRFRLKYAVIVLLVLGSFASPGIFSQAHQYADPQYVVVRIDAMDGGEALHTGSGVVMSADGVIFTAGDIVKGADSFKVRLFDGYRSNPVATYYAELINSSSDSFAMLQITEDEGGKPFSPASETIPYIPNCNLDEDIESNIGQRIYVIGYPRMAGDALAVREDIVGGQASESFGRRGNHPVLITAAEVDRGDLGSAVVDRRGYLVGIVYRIEVDSQEDVKSQLTYILPISTICAIEPDACDYCTPQWCVGNGSPPRLAIGGLGRVISNEAHNLRYGPGVQFNLLGTMPSGAMFLVLDGPQCCDDYNWWQVEYNGMVGWTAEGGDGEYWLAPRN